MSRHNIQGHPLDGAELRFARADRHVNEVSAMILEWSKSCEGRIRQDPDGTYRFNGGFPPISPMLSIVVGDAVHNLRSALEYVVYELAIKHTGSQKKTQFPIEDLKSRFDDRRRSDLKWVSPSDADLIERFQPYNGHPWMAALRDISNSDKHRQLCVLTDEGRQIGYTIHRRPIGKFQADSFIMAENGPEFERFDVEFDGHETIAIAPAEPHSVSLMSTLRQLQIEVTSVIEAFKPAF